MKNILNYSNSKVISLIGLLLIAIIVLVSTFGEANIPYTTWEKLMQERYRGSLIDVTELNWNQNYIEPAIVLNTVLENFYLHGEDLVRHEYMKYDALPKPIIVVSREEDQSRLITNLLVKAGVDSAYFVRGGLVSLKKELEKNEDLH